MLDMDIESNFIEEINILIDDSNDFTPPRTSKQSMLSSCNSSSSLALVAVDNNSKGVGRVAQEGSELIESQIVVYSQKNRIEKHYSYEANNNIGTKLLIDLQFQAIDESIVRETNDYSQSKVRNEFKNICKAQNADPFPSDHGINCKELSLRNLCISIAQKMKSVSTHVLYKDEEKQLSSSLSNNQLDVVRKLILSGTERLHFLCEPDNSSFLTKMVAFGKHMVQMKEKEEQQKNGERAKKILKKENALLLLQSSLSDTNGTATILKEHLSKTSYISSTPNSTSISKQTTSAIEESIVVMRTEINKLRESVDEIKRILTRKQQRKRSRSRSRSREKIGRNTSRRSRSKQ